MSAATFARMVTLVTVALPGRPQLRLLANDTPALREAIGNGLLVLLDKPRERGRAAVHRSARAEPWVTRL